MPFNQLILPLLGGYIFVNHTYLTCYWASRHPKEHMVFLSAVAGAVLLVIARTIAFLLALTEFGQACWAKLHSVVPFPGIGTAVLAFILGFVLRHWFNKAWTKSRAPLWLYAAGQFNKLEEVLFRSAYPVKPSHAVRRHPWRHLALGLIGWHRIQGLLSRLPFVRVPSAYLVESEHVSPQPVMICMKNRKVYVGFIEFALPMRAEVKTFITLLPAWSGYRDKDTLAVIPTTDYEETYDYIVNAAAGGDALDLGKFLKALCIDDVETVNLYDDDAFVAFSPPDDSEPGDAQNNAHETPDWSVM
ncbi:MULTISPECIES: hypothetical protein [unclassified Luteibacter]|uniref:hypothetical protein n=1 Tax=unclassified Luteibacter TaxID=2620188 RepID=UPI001113F059|nr:MULTISPECIES: hypothetical protein [unclassified Luteibacter]MDR6937060.1 hypothetical protein [Luteibacter sp. 3190]